MNALQLFTHRAPNSRIPFLSDPFPERLNGTTSLFNRAEMLSSQRAYFAAPKQQPMQLIRKK